MTVLYPMNEKLDMHNVTFAITLIFRLQHEMPKSQGHDGQAETYFNIYVIIWKSPVL